MFIGLCRPHVFTGFAIRVKCDFCKNIFCFVFVCLFVCLLRLGFILIYDLLTVMCWTAVSWTVTHVGVVVIFSVIFNSDFYSFVYATSTDSMT